MSCFENRGSDVMLVQPHVTTYSDGLLSHLRQPTRSLNLSIFQNIKLITFVKYFRCILKDTCLLKYKENTFADRLKAKKLRRKKHIKIVFQVMEEMHDIRK